MTDTLTYTLTPLKLKCIKIFTYYLCTCVLTQTLTFNTNGPESIARGKDMTRGISFQGEGEESPQVRVGIVMMEWRRC
jgi:hypothetical protein